MGADLEITRLAKERGPEFETIADKAHKEWEELDPQPSIEILMGYIQEAWWKVFQGVCFRDAYNVGNLLSQLGLSWHEDVIPMCEGQKMRGEKILEFKNMIESREVPPPESLKLVRPKGFELMDQVEKRVNEHLEDDSRVEIRSMTPDTYSPQGWYDYFQWKRGALLDVLNTAIETGEEILVSV
jgi:hypothetical protein